MKLRDLLLGAVTPEGTSMRSIERLAFLEPVRKRIEDLDLREVLELLLEQNLLSSPRSQSRNASGEVARPIDERRGGNQMTRGAGVSV